jgi:flavin reductase (DIM6/NTAB) family NADH-FMN oxidoreductase RutF
MECRLMQVVEVSTRARGGNLVIGEVVRFHIDDAIVHDFKIDPDALRAVARMGGDDYSRTRDRFQMTRPSVKLTK